MTENTALGGTFKLTEDITVNRLGYGAMQLAGPGVFGPPKDKATAIAVLKEAISSGINHIDTSDFYGPHITNQLIKEALYPYPANLTIVTKVGAKRDSSGNWLPASSADELRRAVEDNLRNLGLDTLYIVNYRIHNSIDSSIPNNTSIAEPFSVLADMQTEGLIKHLGISTATAEQIEEAEKIAPIVCVQNMYNIANRQDDQLIDWLKDKGIAYVPYFPLGGFSPLQSDTLNQIALKLNVSPMTVALAWLLQRSPNILLIPGTSSLQHLRENLASADLKLAPEIIDELNTIGGNK